MKRKFICYHIFWISLYILNNFNINSCEEGGDFRKKSTVLISIISRNEEHLLPTFISYIERLNYPKKRISILIQTDHNEDTTFKVLSEWIANVRNEYHQIIIKHEPNPQRYEDAKGPNDWPRSRFLQMLKLRQNALLEARRQWADFILFTDGDNFLLNSEMLNILMNQRRTVIAPMLRLFDPKSGYSNFWGGVDETGYYRRVPEYFNILKWDLVGTFAVPMVHSTYLIDLRHNLTDRLQFHPLPTDFNKAIDDILVFAHSVKSIGLEMHICNIEHFGYMLETINEDSTLEFRKRLFLDTSIDYIAYNEPLTRSKNVPFTYPTPTYAGFDEIYLINLVRRPDRRIRMELSMKELGLKWKYFPAVDGKNLTQKKIEEMGVVGMSDFKDPYLQRPLTFGEIGCFMSHWHIWQEVVERKLDMVLLLEDDVRFELDFMVKMKEVMRQAKEISETVGWDLLYFGRKHMSRKKEYYVNDSDKIVWARYSYWTLGYVLRLSGAKKLLAGNPLPKMIPVDEYIPIMFDDHPDTWLKERFSPRNLIGLSASPLLVYPTHYVGDEGYISDTEDTLSFNGESVERFRKQKEIDKIGSKSPKMQADEIQPKEESRPAVNKVTHGEL